MTQPPDGERPEVEFEPGLPGESDAAAGAQPEVLADLPSGGGSRPGSGPAPAGHDPAAADAGAGPADRGPGPWPDPDTEPRPDPDAEPWLDLGAEPWPGAFAPLAGSPVGEEPGSSVPEPRGRLVRTLLPGLAEPPGAVRGARSRLRATIAVALVAAAACLSLGVVGGVAGGWLYERARSGPVHDRSLTLPSAPASASAAAAAAGRSPDSVAAVAARVLPSVVAIEVDSGTEGGTGSGFVIDSGGYILTNNHVVAAAGSTGTITVVFEDGRHAKARVVGSDPYYDLAVIKADTGGRAPLLLGDSDSVVVGDQVIAIGAPLGLQGTVTTGIVSALHRPVAAGEGSDQAYIDAVQTDAAINPGNSGGPLVDASGRVVGVNSAIARAPGSLAVVPGSIGLGFAIPSNQARRTAQELIRTGHSAHPVIGVLLDRTYSGEGVLVSKQGQGGTPPVTPDGPADRAGMRAGDVILALDGRPVTDPDELIVAIRAKAPGDRVVLRIRRAGLERDLQVTLEAASK